MHVCFSHIQNKKTNQKQHKHSDKDDIKMFDFFWCLVQFVSNACVLIAGNPYRSHLPNIYKLSQHGEMPFSSLPYALKSLIYKFRCNIIIIYLYFICHIYRHSIYHSSSLISSAHTHIHAQLHISTILDNIFNIIQHNVAERL